MMSTFSDAFEFLNLLISNAPDWISLGVSIFFMVAILRFIIPFVG